MRSRRVPVLRLGSRGPGGDARSLRLCPPSVRKRPRVSKIKSVNSHRDRGGPGRETQNCRHFWTRLRSSRLKNVNSHRDRGSRGPWSRNAESSSRLALPLERGDERGERRKER